MVLDQQETNNMAETLGDYIDMLDEIEQGYDDDFKWVNQEFITSLRSYIDKNNMLSDKQKIAIRNIYTGRSR